MHGVWLHLHVQPVCLTGKPGHVMHRLCWRRLTEVVYRICGMYSGDPWSCGVKPWVITGVSEPATCIVMIGRMSMLMDATILDPHIYRPAAARVPIDRPRHYPRY